MDSGHITTKLLVHNVQNPTLEFNMNINIYIALIQKSPTLKLIFKIVKIISASYN